MPQERRKLIPTLLAVVLGVAFLAATLMMSNTMKASLTAQSSASVNGADAVVSADLSTTVPTSAVQKLAGQSGISSVDPTISTGLTLTRGGGQTSVEGDSTPQLGNGTKLISGHMPRSANEVAVNSLTADSGARPGSDITVSGFQNDGKPRTLTVVGVVDPGPRVSQNTGTEQVFTDPGILMDLRGQSGYDKVYVTGTGGQQRVADAVRSVPGLKAKGITVRTADAERAALTSEQLGGTGVLTGLLAAFAVIAVVVAAIVIANTFAILVAQRTRALALARCVGATQKQVRNSVLGEALLVGVVGSVIGLAAGAGLAQLLVTVGGSATNIPLNSTISVSATSIVVPLIVGVLVTVLAALPPARRATRVPPVAALSPLPAPTTKRIARTRLITGAVLLVGGAGLLVYGAVGAQETTVALVSGISGGLLSFVGVLVLAVAVIPRLAQALGHATARVSGVPGELAAENTQRNPGRATATVSALLVGVTLIVMTAVGGSSAEATMNTMMDARYPTDATVTTASGQVPGGLVKAVQDAKGVDRAASVTTAEAQVAVNGKSQKLPVTGYSSEAREAMRDTSTMSGLGTGRALVSLPGVSAGDTVTLRNGGHTLSLKAVTPQSGASSGTVSVTSADMGKLAPDAQASQILVRYSAGASPDEASSSVTKAIAKVPGASIDSQAQNRRETQQIVNVMLSVVVGLLAISVIIALVGVANTLGLSVVERTREIGLLRALGLTRRQVRAMLGHEAVLLALAAVVVGLVLGAGYGIAGTYALLGTTGHGIVVTVALPWVQLAAVVAIGLAAAWMASVLPGRHAARIRPSVALAAE